MSRRVHAAVGARDEVSPSKDARSLPHHPRATTPVARPRPRRTGAIPRVRRDVRVVTRPRPDGEAPDPRVTAALGSPPTPPSVPPFDRLRPPARVQTSADIPGQVGTAQCVRRVCGSVSGAYRRSSETALTVGWVPTLEEIVYDAGKEALADQEAVVTGIRQRTGTLLAAHALVASFLGATTVKARGLHGFGWFAVAALVAGLIVAAVVLSNWRMRFAVDAPELYDELYSEAEEEADAGTLGWLVSAAYGYQQLRAVNAQRVRIMGWLLTTLGILMVLQTLFWLAALR